MITTKIEGTHVHCPLCDYTRFYPKGKEIPEDCPACSHSGEGWTYKKMDKLAELVDKTNKKARANKKGKKEDEAGVGLEKLFG